MLTIADKGGRGDWQMLTMDDTGGGGYSKCRHWLTKGVRGLANIEITETMPKNG